MREVKRQRVAPRSEDLGLLYSVICGRWNHRLLLDKDNRVFLNINPAWIEPVIDYLRDASRSNSMESIRSRLNESDALGLDAVITYFNLSNLIDEEDPQIEDSESIRTDILESTPDVDSNNTNTKDALRCSLRILSAQMPSRILALRNTVASDISTYMRLVLRIAENLQREEERLLLELLWIDHYCTITQGRPDVGGLTG
jgi:hypothetical protein